MIDNFDLFESLIRNGTLKTHGADMLRHSPEALPNDFDFSKIEGMLLGVAVGDALGATSEGMLPADRYRKFGEISNYVPGHRSRWKPIGVPTDDTQLTFWTLKQLIEDNGFIPDNLAKRFCKHHIIGEGTTTKGSLGNYKDGHKPWYSAGLESVSNGALMRISPIVIPYLKTPSESMYADAALDTMITHNSYANTATCVAFVSMLWSLLSMKKAPKPQWWIDSYCSIAEKVEGNTQYVPRVPRYQNYTGPLWQFTEKVVNDALRRHLSVLEACNEWGSGANLFETVPSVLYILALHGQNGEESIIRAVNDTKDNDSVAAIVGAAVGALHGSNGIPDRWIKGLTGRTRSDNDGEVFKLISMAQQKFWS
jgi:ADP-ribosylglycohydrolase